MISLIYHDHKTNTGVNLARVSQKVYVDGEER